jgi:predicted O-methyltransferase YrrM
VALFSAVLGAEVGVAAGLGAGVAVLTGVVLSATARVERQVRNAEDAAAIAALLGPDVPSLGTWAVEADFGRLVAQEMEGRPGTIVECGSGVTTLLIASYLQSQGAGLLYSLEHDEGFAEATRRRLARAGLTDRVEVVVAPLVAQRFGRTRTRWYDPAAIGDALEAPIDLLVVDGPPSVEAWSRWPAIEVLNPLLAPGAVVLLDDGRQRRERRAAWRWQREHREFELYWLDTAKGTWKLVKGDRSRSEGPLARALRLVLRTLNPRPTGFGRWPVRR